MRKVGGRGAGGGGLRELGLGPEGAEGDLSGVEELAAVCVVDCTHDYAVGGTGDEIADALIAGERRHGVAIGLLSSPARPVFIFALGADGQESGFPGVAAEGDGGDLAGGTGFVSGGDFGGNFNGLDHGSSPFWVNLEGMI